MDKKGAGINKVKWALMNIPEIVSSAALFLAVIVNFVNAVARYAFNYSLLGADQFVSLMFSYVIFFGAIVAYKYGQHYGVDVLTNLLPPKAQRWLKIIIDIFLTCLNAYLAYLAFKFSFSAMIKKFNILGISYFWLDIPMAICFLVMMFISIKNTVVEIKNKVSDSPETTEE